MVFKNMYISLKTAMERSVTRLYPEKVMDFAPACRGLHYLDPSKCTGCGICAQNCPNKCIWITQEETKDSRLFPEIDVGHCMFCGICLEVCPEDALSWSRAFELAAWSREETVYSPAQLFETYQRKR